MKVLRPHQQLPVNSLCLMVRETNRLWRNLIPSLQLQAAKNMILKGLMSRSYLIVQRHLKMKLIIRHQDLMMNKRIIKTNEELQNKVKVKLKETKE